jgi:hypothetical protein
MPSSSLPLSISPVHSHILNVNVIQSMHCLIPKVQLLLLLVQSLLLDTQAKLGSVPSNSRENCEVRVPKNFGRARSSKSQEIAEKSTFREFFGSLKNRGKPRKIQISKPVHCKKTVKNFWTSPSFKILRHRGKIRVSRFLLGPLKIARNHGKIEISEASFFQKNA